MAGCSVDSLEVTPHSPKVDGMTTRSTNFEEPLVDGESAEDSESESEASRLETEDSSEDEDDPLDGLDLHPIHCLRPTAGIRTSVALPGCKNAFDMAVAGAADPKVGVRQTRLVKCSIKGGILKAVADNFDLEIDVINATMGIEPCSGSLAKGLVTLCIVPSPSKADAGPAVSKIPSTPSSPCKKPGRPSWTGMLKEVITGGSGTRSPQPPKDGDVYGWLFSCSKESLRDVLVTLALNGCYRTGLQDCYKAMKGNAAGSGSFGTVVGAVEVHGDSVVAIKHLKSGTAPDVLEAEVEMLVRAQGHPSIIKFHGCFVSPGLTPSYSLVFDYYNRGDLYDRVAEGKRMFEKDAMPPLRDLLEGLRFLHERSIFHRDVKPENLLVANAAGKVVLTDFGIATLITDTVAMKQSTGTVGYASPEMLRGEATSFEGDAFGAGIVLYFMLSRSTPFLAPTAALMAENTQDCHVNLNYACFEHMSADCRSLILRLIEKDPQERMTIEDALKVPILKTCMATATEPALATLVKQKKPNKISDLPTDNASASPAYHHQIALSVGELPALRKVPYQCPKGNVKFPQLGAFT